MSKTYEEMKLEFDRLVKELTEFFEEMEKIHERSQK